MIYELEDGEIKLIAESNPVHTISLVSIYQQKISDKFTLLINSFKNKVLVVESDKIKNNMINVDSFLSKWFETPSSDLDHFTPDKLYDEKLLLESRKKIQALPFSFHRNRLFRRPLTTLTALKPAALRPCCLI